MANRMTPRAGDTNRTKALARPDMPQARVLRGPIGRARTPGDPHMRHACAALIDNQSGYLVVARSAAAVGGRIATINHVATALDGHTFPNDRVVKPAPHDGDRKPAKFAKWRLIPAGIADRDVDGIAATGVAGAIAASCATPAGNPIPALPFSPRNTMGELR